MSVKVVFYCPQCGDPSVHQVEGSEDLQCGGCHHRGAAGTFPSSRIEVQENSDQQLADQLVKGMGHLIVSELAIPFGRYLIDNGFISNKPIDPKQLQLYLTAIAKASLQAVLETARQETVGQLKARKNIGQA